MINNVGNAETFLPKNQYFEKQYADVSNPIIQGKDQETKLPTYKTVEKAEQKGTDYKNPCKTCESRSYQDESGDPGVSMKSPTKLSPAAAGSAVRAHEQEHVTRNQAKAKQEGREILSQTVSIHTGICPECGKTYVSGGTTRTVTAAKKENNNNEGAKGNTGNANGISGVDYSV